MAGVDNRIVTMQFNNSQFEQGARTSISTLQKLKESMSFGQIVGGTVKGLGAIDSAISKIGLKTPFSPMIRAANSGLGMIGGVLDKIGLKNPFSRGVEGASELQKAAQVAGGPAGLGVLEGGVTAVSNKFLALTTIAVTALANITNRAISSGTAFLKSFSFAPVMDGLREYELNLKSIQTIQANTDRPLPEIEGALNQLNKYSDQTIYNFSEMAKNVGTFTAAGVDLKTSVSSIKGIANLAALSGSNSQQAATAMYQLSQAIAAGKVGLMDWNSVVNAGMGGKKLQNALAQTAVAMGELDKNSVKMVGPMQKLTINGNSFRESIMAKPGEQSWLSSEALVNTLAVMDGRFSDAALAAEKTETGLKKYSKAQRTAMIADARAALEKKNGVKYTDEQFKALARMSTMAFKSATEVKTLGQVFEIAKETIASGWSASFKNIFGGLEEAKELFTGASRALNGLIEQNALARNKLLVAWSKGGGRLAIIDGLKNSWKALLNILGPIKDGFRDIFPAKTAENLISMSKSFEAFTKRMIPGKETMENLRDIAGGVFSIFGIGKMILGGIVTLFKSLFDTVGGGNGNFLAFVAGIGESVKRFHDFLAASGLITTFFTTLGKILAVPIGLLKSLGGLVAGVFQGFDTGVADKVGAGLEGVSKRFGALQVVGENLRAFFVKVGMFFGNLGSHIGDALKGIGDVVASAFTTETFGSTLDVINTTLLGGLVLMLKNFFSEGVKIDLGGGLFKNINDTLGEATQAFKTMQTSLKADILMKIAISIGVMAAALMVLSMIDPGKLAKALGAMSAGLAILIAAITVMMKTLGAVGILQLYAVSSAMTKMALAVLALAFALKTLAGIKFGDMLRGLLGLSIMLKMLTKAMVPLAKGSKGMVKAAFSLILLGVAINILAVALKIFATMSWEEMARGLVGLAGVLLALAVGLKLMPDLNAEAVTLVALGIAINLLAVALKVFATMSWVEMAKGILMLAGSLGVISLAMRTMPKGMLLQAVALNGVAAAMVVLSGALKVMGGMGWEEIAKGLATMAGAMLILAIGLNAMGIMGFVGAAALLVAAHALAVLVPVLAILGNLKVSTIVTSLLALAGIFVVLGAAGYLLAPVIPIILGLGAAFLLFGAGLALAGAGALAAATAFGIVVAAGMAGAQVLAAVLLEIIKSIPKAMAAFGKGMVSFAVAIGKGAPRIAKAFGQILSNLLDSVIKNAPKMAKAFLAMLDAVLKVISRAFPKIVNAGLRLIVGFLGAISKNIGKITSLGADIIVKFLNAISRKLPKIIDSGVRLILAFIRGVTKAVRENDRELGEAGADLGIALVEGTAQAIVGAGGKIRDAAMAAAKAAWESVKNFFKVKSPSRLMRDTVGKPIMQGWALGMRDEAPAISNEMKNAGRSALDVLRTTMANVEDAFSLDPNLNPTVTPVLDLTALTKEANKMSSILATAPIMPTASYRIASDISAATQADIEARSGGDGGGGGDTHVTYEQHLHSPTPLDSVKIYRDGKSLIALAKETLK